MFVAVPEAHIARHVGPNAVQLSGAPHAVAADLRRIAVDAVRSDGFRFVPRSVLLTVMETESMLERVADGYDAFNYHLNPDFDDHLPVPRDIHDKMGFSRMIAACMRGCTVPKHMMVANGLKTSPDNKNLSQSK